MHHTRKRQVFPVSIGPELNFVSLCFVEPIKSYLEIQSMRKTPPKALGQDYILSLRLWRTIQAEGSTERDWRRVVTRVTDAQSRRTCRFPSPRRRAKHCDTGGMPGSVWLHFEEASTTLLQFRVNTQLEKSYFNNNLPLLLANAMLSALLLFIKKNRASRNK